MTRNIKKKRLGDDAGLMTTASRAVVHLRAQHGRNRLGLIFGSGASKDIGFPDWDELVTKIAAHQDVDADALMQGLRNSDPRPSRSLASLTHILFEHYRTRRLAQLGLSGSIPILQEQKFKSDWLRIIHAELYSGIDHQRRQKIIEAHSYLTAFRDIIKNSPLTVNYNFDDTLEKLLIHSRTPEETTTTRGYETTDKPNCQFQKDEGVIYHPNGFLPSSFDDGASAEVVFANDAFQDQLISAANGRYVHLSNHLFKNTCLLIGLSLEDTTLQSLLRQNAVTNPGHIHYVVHFMGKDSKLSKDSREAIFKSNFTSYNLYTLFLTANGVRQLAELIRMPEAEFDRHPPHSRKFVYYVIGSIGAGKSTAAANFRNLITYDEWIDERLPEIAQPQSDIGPKAASKVDNWIAEQFRKKNYALQKCSEGIHIVDRCPLDPLTFPGDKCIKAKNLLKTITNNGAFKIEFGHVIMLECDMEELKLRNSLKHKYWTDEALKGLLGEIDNIYASVPKTKICTRGRSINEVAREIAKVVFLSNYEPVEIEAELRKHVEAP